MSILKVLIPTFWDQKTTNNGPFTQSFNFRSIWKLFFLITSCVAIIPLCIFAYLDYYVTKKNTLNEIKNRAAHFLANTQRTVTFYFKERKAVLNFISRNYSVAEMSGNSDLSLILANLKESVGGFTDLELIDSKGMLIDCAGLLERQDRYYGDDEWFREVLKDGFYISDVFFDLRDSYWVIAIKYSMNNGTFHVLRATVDTTPFNELFTGINVGDEGDALLINDQGIVQMPINRQQNGPTRLSPVPERSSQIEIYDSQSADFKPLIMGSVVIPGSPFMLVVIGRKDILIKPWLKFRNEIIFYLCVSIFFILVVVFVVTNRLVNEIYRADQKWVVALRETEHSSKLASIGRLAAGVAHEINNPLAIINEKAGLIKDFFTFSEKYSREDKLVILVDSIINSVERCGMITKQLLGFARHLDLNVELINLEKVLSDVIGFLGKEAEYRNIKVKIDVAADIKEFEADRGKVQQIFLNLINNAIAAMNDGGCLDIIARCSDEFFVEILVKDDGCGISEQDFKRIFEPFFSTKTKQGGTGLGLSITYGLVKEIGGTLDVKSKLGSGTSFYIKLPIKGLGK